MSTVENPLGPAGSTQQDAADANDDAMMDNGLANNSEKYIVFPDSTMRRRWDLVVFCVVIFQCLTVPLRIGFQLHTWKEWIAMDIFCDIFLWSDMVVCALTTFEIDGEMVTDRTEIALHYLKGWFLVDVLGVFPLEVALLAAISYHPLYHANRLLRVTRMAYYFSQWEKVTSLKPSVIRIFKSTFVILFLAHFIGCGFFLVIVIEGSEASADFTGTADILSRPLGSQYIRAFYWSFVTMTGYNNTNPLTQLETIFSIFVTMIGISLFATIIGTVGSLVTNLDSSALYFRQKMDGINDYMKYKRIPQDLQVEVRNYYTYLWKSGKGLDKNKVLDDLPPYLKNKMNLILNSEIIRKVPLFQQCKDDTEFIQEVVKCLKPRVCLPNSFVVRKGEVGSEMYFISRGELNVVSDDDKVVFTLKDGGFFGEIALLYDTKRTASIVARTYCDMFVLTKEDFRKVMRKFPLQSKGIKEIARERFQNIVEQDKDDDKDAAPGGAGGNDGDNNNKNESGGEEGESGDDKDGREMMQKEGSNNSGGEGSGAAKEVAAATPDEK
eukprot:PhM_4_TR17331/c0_g1_i1/m.65710/K04950/CNGA3; cyclic nucleotide gated channel alpha 3